MEDKKSIWVFIERILLILTFIGAIVGTVYSVRTSQKALKQASIELRPWILIRKINSVWDDEKIKSSFQVTNIGKIPAYVSFEVKSFLNDEPSQLESPAQPPKVRALMPNQTEFPVGLIIKNEYYKKAMNKELDVKIFQSIKVNYGTSKETVGEYYVYKKLEFDQYDLPKKIQSLEQSGIWNLIDCDFR